MNPGELVGKYVRMGYGGLFVAVGILKQAGENDEWWCIDDHRQGLIYARKADVRFVACTKPLAEIHHDLQMEGVMTPPLMEDMR